MKGKFVLLTLLMLASAGCNLAVNIVDNPLPSASPTRSQPILEVPTNRALTATPPPPTVTVVQPTPLPNCTPRADWLVYRVAVGDTLGQIAVRSGTSAASLIQANCLTNANLISVGQTLRVPRQPTPPTAIPPTVEPTKTTQQLGSIGLSMYLWADAGNFTLPGGESIAVTWDGGPADALRTDFFQRTPNGAMTLIASDNNPSDGLSVLWVAPINFVGEVTASAIRPDGSSVTPAFRPSIAVIDPNSTSNALTLNTYLRVENDTYTVKPNQPEVISWAIAPPVAARIDFTFSPADHSASRLLGSVTNLQYGASVNATFTAGEYGVVSAEAVLKDGRHLFFARPITVNAPATQPPVETTAEATVEAN
ncbi:MAG: LysM domain-containing protein [Chloroflexota bacterium]